MQRGWPIDRPDIEAQQKGWDDANVHKQESDDVRLNAKDNSLFRQMLKVEEAEAEAEGRRLLAPAKE